MTSLTDDITGAAAPRGVERRTGPGLAFAVCSAASFGLAGALAKGLQDAGWSAAAAVSVRMLLAAVVLLPIAVVALRGRWWLLRRNAGLLAVYGLLGVALCQFAYFNAVQHLEVGVALLIEYVSPVAVVVWMWVRHGERPGVKTAVGGVLAAAGLVLVLDVVGGGGGVDAVGVVWALLAMLGVCFYFVVSAQSDNGLLGTVLAAAGLLIGGVALLVLGAVGIVPLRASTATVHFTRLDAPWWVCVGALGLVTAALAYVTGIAAGRRLGSRLASFVGLGEVLAALVFAWLLLAELPTLVQVAGGVLVLAGVVVVKLGEPRVDGGGDDDGDVSARLDVERRSR